mmetsp:Transcript_12613/g.16270  ORF Transcript_12613/g.16270 Transcript_12613/m.16270 type:complete len:89 (+) Transcript_12613:385-651(+)
MHLEEFAFTKAGLQLKEISLSEIQSDLDLHNRCNHVFRMEEPVSHRPQSELSHKKHYNFGGAITKLHTAAVTALEEKNPKILRSFPNE